MLGRVMSMRGQAQSDGGKEQPKQEAGAWSARTVFGVCLPFLIVLLAILLIWAGWYVLLWVGFRYGPKGSL